MNRVKRGIIISVSIVLIIISIFLIRQLYINSKIHEIEITHEGIVISNAENENKSETCKKVKISIKGTIDERYISSQSNNFVEDDAKVFEGTITIGDDVFELGCGKENALSIAQYENGILQMLCSRNQASGEMWFLIYTDDMNFKRIIILGLEKPIEHKYSNCYIVAPEDDKADAMKEYNDMMKKINE